MSSQLHMYRDDNGITHFIDMEEQASDSMLDNPEFLLMLAEIGDEFGEDATLSDLIGYTSI